MHANTIKGLRNKERVREFFINHPGSTQKECAISLKLSIKIVNLHTKSIRAEWIPRLYANSARRRDQQDGVRHELV